MINQSEAASYLGKELSGAGYNDSVSIHQAMRRFLAYTARNIRERNYDAVNKCFLTAGKLYEKGNAVVKHTVENVFVCSFNTLLTIAQENRKQVMALIPLSLFLLYEKEHQLHQMMLRN